MHAFHAFPVTGQLRAATNQDRQRYVRYRSAFLKLVKRKVTLTIIKILPLIFLSATAGADNFSTALDSRAEKNLFSLPLVGNLQSMGYRVTSSDGNNFDGLTRHALFLDFGLPWTWSGQSGFSVSSLLTLEAGRLRKDSEYRNFLSLGPVLRLTNDRWIKSIFVDVGLSPTVIDGTTYGDRKLGTSFNFTSHLALGLRFGENKDHTVKLRYEHISNNGFGEVNPGVNMVGIDFVFWSK